MTNKNRKELQPELRFPEFCKDNDWSHETLSRLAVPVKERAKKLTPNDVLTLSGEHGLVRQTEYFGKTIAGSDLKRYLRIEQNDFVYNDRTTSAAKYGSLKRLTDYPVGAVSPIYKCFRFKEEEQAVFWEHYFNAGAHENALGEFINEGARAGRFNISVDTFLAISVCYPKNKAEQQKIADCLDSLDDLIGAHSRKLAALQDHKKGLLQQLFPAEGETTPKLRFPEFDGEWVEQAISQFAKVTTGNKDTQNKVESGRHPFFVRSQTVERINSYSYDGEAVLTSGDGVGVGKNFHYIQGKFDFHQRVYCIYDFKKEISARFFYLYFSEHFRKRVLGMSAKNSVDSVRMSMITEMPVALPPLPEQQKIADCLSALDALITAQTEQIAALKEHKKGLMQKLFPNP